jgi:NADH:ubiquinone oxidoreductase subunit K
MIHIDNFLVLSTIIFALGLYGVLSRRNAVLVVMSVELMLQAVTINFIAFAVYLWPEEFSGLIVALFVITIAAAEVGLALAIILRLYRNRRTANVDEANLMKW